MEVKTLVCPNCGANTTNSENCEYCNSLLVRFVDKGIDISNTSYFSDDCAFPAIATNLKRNLELQAEYPHESVVTDIYWSGHGVSVLRSGLSLWMDHIPIRLGSNDGGLIVVLGFYESEKTELEKLKALPSYPLFTSHLCKISGEFVKEYAIDFGKDADGAAKLISEILSKVYGLKPEDEYSVFTNVGNEIEKSRKEAKSKYGFREPELLWKIVLAILIFIGGLISMFIG